MCMDRYVFPLRGFFEFHLPFSHLVVLRARYLTATVLHIQWKPEDSQQFSCYLWMQWVDPMWQIIPSHAGFAVSDPVSPLRNTILSHSKTHEAIQELFMRNMSQSFSEVEVQHFTWVTPPVYLWGKISFYTLVCSYSLVFICLLILLFIVVSASQSHLMVPALSLIWKAL